MVENSYIVAIPDRPEPRELSRKNLLEELARGTIKHSYWVWSAEHDDWKQISEIPALNPPTLRKGTPGLAPLAPLASVTPIEPITIPQNSSAKKKKKRVKPRRERSEEEGFSYTKAFFVLLYAAVLAVVGLNYLLVDKPFDAALARSRFVLIDAHAHLGSFVQPGALVIHVLPSHELSEKNFADFLYTLAQGMPAQPWGSKPFDLAALTPGWRSEYALPGADWRRLAGMENATSEIRQNFITDHLCTVTGQPLIHRPEALGPDDLKAKRAQVWQELTAKFLE